MPRDLSSARTAKQNTRSDEAIWNFAIRKSRKTLLANLQRAPLGSCRCRVEFYTCRGGDGQSFRSPNSQSPIAHTATSCFPASFVAYRPPEANRDIQPRNCDRTKTDPGIPKVETVVLCVSKSPCLHHGLLQVTTHSANLCAGAAAAKPSDARFCLHLSAT